jgi:hypothetical protein
VEAVTKELLMPEQVEINPMVALAEAQALAEYYRNRSLIFHQKLFDAAQPKPETTAEAEPEKDAE